MTSFTWNSGSIGSWGSSSNWTPNTGVPGSGDIAFLVNTGNAQVFSNAYTVSALDINGSATTTLEASQGVGTGGTLDILNTTTLSKGVISIDDSASALITNAFTQITAGGILQSAGLFSVTGLAGFTQGSGKSDQFAGGTFDAGSMLMSGAGNFEDTETTNISGNVTITNGSILQFGTTSSTTSTHLGGLSLNDSSALTLDLGGSVSITNGTTTAAKDSIAMLGGTLSAGTGGIVNTGTLTGFGLINGSGSISSTGTVIATGGKLELGIAAGTGALLNIANSSSNILKLDAAETNVKVTFGGAGSAGVLELNDFTTGSPDSLNFTTSMIVSMGTAAAATGDIINIQGAAVTSVTDTGTNGVLTIKDASGTLTTITMSSGGSAKATFAKDTGSLGGYDVWLVCYAAGTHIQTPDGDVTVESLAAGDSVVVLDGDRHVPTPVKWVGYRRLDLTAHPRPDMVAPVRIRRGAFAENLPRRDLFVSPDHCMFVDGKLIPAKLLINDMTIVQERDTRVVEYYHVELDRHAVLFAEGLPAESYLDTGNRAFFSNAGLALVLHPEFHVNAGLRCWETDACAPLAVSAEAVEPVWRDLAARAESLGYARPEIATTDDADLRLVANGRTIRPVATNGGCHVFVLPPGASAVRLASRAGAPSDVVPYLEDWRRLGVAVNRIVVRSSAEQIEIPADHPGLTQGWHAVEHEGAALWRWTDGNARLPIAASTEPLTVEVHVRQTMQYRLETAEPRRLVA